MSFDKLRFMRGRLPAPSDPASAAVMAPSQLALVLIAGLLIRLTFIQAPGYHDDMTIFYRWFTSIATLAPSDVYAHTDQLNYPPVFVLIYEFCAIAMRAVVHGPPSEYTLNIVLKLPAILFDIIGAALAYVIVRRRATHLAALTAAALIALNPAIIYDSAYWGQIDSIPTVIALLAVYALSTRKIVVAWLTITAAVLIKPPVLVLVPLFVLYPFTLDSAQRRRRLIETAFGIASALALTEVLAYVFFAHPTPVTAMRHLVSQIYYNCSGYFPFTTLNAFNLWALFGRFFEPDTTRVLFLSMHAWGTLLFCVAAALIYWRYLRSRDRDALLAAATLILLAFFLCLTEMHERYLIYCVMFIPALTFKQPYRTAALVLSLTLLLNLEYGLTFMYLDDAKATMVDRFAFAPWLVHLCSLANIGVFGWLLAPYLGFDRSTQGHEQSALSSEILRRSATVTPLRKPVNR